MFQELRDAVRQREQWVITRVRVRNQIHRWLDIWFPEFRQVFPDPFGVRALATLRRFPTPADLVAHTPDGLVAEWAASLTRAGGRRGQTLAVTLHAQARTSVGRTVGRERAKRDLAYLLRIYGTASAAIQDADQDLARLLTDAPGAALLGTVGLTPTAVAVILGYGGDLRPFQHGNQLLRKAGLNLVQQSSGRHRGQVTLSKRGHPLLRKHLFLATCSLIAHNGTFRAWPTQNLQKGYTRMASVMKLTGRRARILVAMVQTNRPFAGSA